MSTDHTETLRPLNDLFAKHTGSRLWHGVILSTSRERSEDGPDPWDLVAVHEPLARYPALGRSPMELRGEGAIDGRYFGEATNLEAFMGAADAAYRWLQQSPLRELADRAIPPRSPRDYSSCWVAVIYFLAWECESPLLLARQRHVCESVGPLEAREQFYHVDFAFMERDVFTMSFAAVELLQRQVQKSSDKRSTGSPTASVAQEGNSIRKTAEIWHLRYQGELGEYPAKGNQSIGWLVKLLAYPNRSLSVADLLGDPEGKLATDARLGEERATSEEGIEAIKRRLEEIAGIMGETGGSESLEDEQAQLLRQLEAAGDGKQLSSPLRKAHHNIATQIRTFLKNKLAKDMPSLAAHLTASLRLDFPDVGYYPPAATPAWKI
jgi:hypothetical protein